MVAGAREGAQRPAAVGFDARVAAVVGAMLGTALGDAMALPAEGLDRERAQRLFPSPLVPSFWPRGGVWASDDTEHARMLAQAAIAHPGMPEDFASAFAWKLRWWILGLPAGVGFATLRACLKLWLFLPNPAIFSAGNGPAMRVAPLAAAYAYEPELRRAMVEASAQLTHSDPRATVGALAVAELTAWAARHPMGPRPPVSELEAILEPLAPREDEEWGEVVAMLYRAAKEEVEVEGLANLLGLHEGVSGYVYHSVPVAIYAWWRHFGDYRATVEACVGVGGDTDSVAAMAGGIAGAGVREGGLPEDWCLAFTDRPASLGHLKLVAESLARAAAEGPQPAVSLAWWLLPFRNLAFLVGVFGHLLVRAFR